MNTRRTGASLFLIATCLLLVACPRTRSSADLAKLDEQLIDDARAGNLDDVRSALADGASFTYKNAYQETALMNAADAGRTEVVEYLLSKGADPEVTNAEKRTALTFALMGSFDATATVLIKAFKDPQQLQAPEVPEDMYLNIAARNSARQSLFELLQRGVPPDSENDYGRTPLSLYAEYDEPEMVQLLLGYHANPRHADGDGKTPDMWASEAGAWDVLEVLRAAGVTPRKVPLKPKRYAIRNPLADAQKWALAVDALTTLRRRQSCEILGGKPDSVEIGVSKFILANFWDVNDHASAIKCLEWLKNTGQRTKFAAVLGDLQAGGSSIPASFSTTEAEIVRKEALRHPSSGLLAWDYCRLVDVAGQSFHAGYLSEDEAWHYVFDAGRALQSAYPSWKALSDDYLLGRAIWAHRAQDDLTYLQGRLLDPREPSSPWNLDWATPL